jgi:aminoglycoside 6'-N-acetyltransferase I
LRAELWPESSAEEHARELELILAGRMPDTFPLTVLLAVAGGTMVGFLEVRLRSHADCCDQSCPVGYVEGWFVTELFRRLGVGAALLAAAEEWARNQGCKEMASDAEIGNVGSQRAHEALGFEAVSRSVNYRKRLV